MSMTLNVSGRFATGFAWKNTLLSKNDRITLFKIRLYYTARIFANKLEDMVEFLIPKYAQEGKTSLVIAVGCTGGKHRSVTIARELYSRIARNGEYGFRLEHRDVDKDRLLKK